MKTFNKIAITTAVALIPFGIFAQEHFDEDKNYKRYNKMDYSQHRDFNDIESSFKQYLLKRGVNYSFEGKLQSKPKNDINGEWVIDGIKVIVNDKTFIKQSKKIIKIGDTIEIKAKRENNKIIVVILEQENSFFE